MRRVRFFQHSRVRRTIGSECIISHYRSLEKIFKKKAWGVPLSIWSGAVRFNKPIISRRAVPRIPLMAAFSRPRLSHSGKERSRKQRDILSHTIRAELPGSSLFKLSEHVRRRRAVTSIKFAKGTESPLLRLKQCRSSRQQS